MVGWFYKNDKTTWDYGTYINRLKLLQLSNLQLRHAPEKTPSARFMLIAIALLQFRQTLKSLTIMNKLAKLLLLLTTALVVLNLQQAKGGLVGGTFVSDLDAGNTAISGFTGPYGFVVVMLTSSTTANVEVQSNTVGSNVYLFGGVNAVALNVNASLFDVSGIAESNSGTGFTPGPGTSGGSGNVSSFGTFNLTINNFDGFTHSADEITFTLTNTGGTWGTADDVLTPNANGFDAAGHVFVTSAPADAANGAIATGFAGETHGNVHVPDAGSTAMLLAFALTGLGLLRRRIQR